MRRFPVLIIEGSGDKRAVPRLIRDTLSKLKIYHIFPEPNPIAGGSYLKLLNLNEFERYLLHAIYRERGDSVLVVLDCDDHCPVHIAGQFCKRAEPIARRLLKPVAICLLRREFEMLFLYSLESISKQLPHYGVDLNAIANEQDFEEVRGAKELLKSAMRRGYRPTRDQENLLTALDHERLTDVSRSYRHFLSALGWLATWDETKGFVYPPVS